jgi:predicted DNA-binding transcriptional regulator AlpA
MKNTHLQFGLRKNTAPSRQHVSRPKVKFQRFQPHCNSKEVLEKWPSSRAKAPALAADFGMQKVAMGGEKIDDTQLLSVQDVARLLRVPVSWVYEHTRPKCTTPLPYIKLGRYLRFLPADISRYLEDARSPHDVLR